jgi:hypothetical protein
MDDEWGGLRKAMDFDQQGLWHTEALTKLEYYEYEYIRD